MSSRPRNHCNVSNKLNSRPEKFRKNLSFHTQGTSKGDCVQEVNDDFYHEAHNYDFDCPSDNEFKASDDRSSNDSMSICDPNINPDGNGDVEQQYQDFDTTKQREKFIQDTYTTCPNNKRTPLCKTPQLSRKCPEYPEWKAYEPATDPQAVLAVQKLQKLKELQRRRDYYEKYYSQEIRRLIGDKYIEAKVVHPTLGRQSDRVYPPNYAGDRPTTNADNLEPCGTMTTITRLDCGCLEQTIRPIFTTPSGRTQKRTCAQEQQVNMRISTPNARILLGNHSAKQATPTNKLKSKSFAETSRNHTSNAANSNKGFENTQEINEARSTSPT